MISVLNTDSLIINSLKPSLILDYTWGSQSHFFWKMESMSMGRGNTIVEFFSDEMEFKVWNRVNADYVYRLLYLSSQRHAQMYNVHGVPEQKSCCTSTRSELMCCLTWRFWSLRADVPGGMSWIPAVPASVWAKKLLYLEVHIWAEELLYLEVSELKGCCTWRYLSWRAAGLCSIMDEASRRALEALISPSAAITLEWTTQIKTQTRNQLM